MSWLITQLAYSFFGVEMEDSTEEVETIERSIPANAATDRYHWLRYALSPPLGI
jgi:hypothetical protein